MAWGKLKVSGENTMYPKPLMELAGWEVHSIASGGATFAAAATSVSGKGTPNEKVERLTVAWGHALNGELGYGAGGKKSSANPAEVPSLSPGANTLQVAMGAAHSMFLVERGDPFLEEIEVWSPGEGVPDVEEAAAPAVDEGGGGGGGGAGGAGGGGGKGVKRKGGAGGVAPAAVAGGGGRGRGRGRGRPRKS